MDSLWICLYVRQKRTRSNCSISTAIKCFDLKFRRRLLLCGVVQRRKIPSWRSWLKKLACLSMRLSLDAKMRIIHLPRKSRRRRRMTLCRSVMRRKWSLVKRFTRKITKSTLLITDIRLSQWWFATNRLRKAKKPNSLSTNSAEWTLPQNSHNCTSSTKNPKSASFYATPRTSKPTSARANISTRPVCPRIPDSPSTTRLSSSRTKTKSASSNSTEQSPQHFAKHPKRFSLLERQRMASPPDTSMEYREKVWFLCSGHRTFCSIQKRRSAI